MTIIVEPIKEKDAKKYGFDEVYFKHFPWEKEQGSNAYSGIVIWALDQEKDSYLAAMGSGREGESDVENWAFFHQGNNYFVQTCLDKQITVKETKKNIIGIRSSDIDPSNKDKALIEFKKLFSSFENYIASENRLTQRPVGFSF